jgi:serine/threonine protein kinase
MTYTILKRIGTGSYGTVFLIQSTENNKYYALKRINLDDASYSGDIRRQLHEINILFFQLCLGIKYLHDNKIIHRDLKPANILLDNKISPKKVIIIDFGASIILNKNNYDFANTIIGTPYFMCPEQCVSKKYNNKCDIWALGCILYELLTLEKPFVAHNIALLNYKISIGKYKELSNTYADPDIDVFKRIIRMCLDKNINNRASIYDIFNVHEMYIRTIKLNLKFKDLDTPIILNNKNITRTELTNFINSLRAYIQNNNHLSKSEEDKLNIKIVQSSQLSYPTQAAQLPIINKISHANKNILQHSPIKKNIILPLINNKYSLFLPPVNNKLPPINNNLQPVNNNNLQPLYNKLPQINNNNLQPVYNKLPSINNNKSQENSDEEKIEVYKLK